MEDRGQGLLAHRAANHRSTKAPLAPNPLVVHLNSVATRRLRIMEQRHLIDPIRSCTETQCRSLLYGVVVFDPPSDFQAGLSHVPRGFLSMVLYITGWYPCNIGDESRSQSRDSYGQPVAYLGAPAILSFIDRSDERSVGAGEEEMTQYELKRAESVC